MPTRGDLAPFHRLFRDYAQAFATSGPPSAPAEAVLDEVLGGRAEGVAASAGRVLVHTGRGLEQVAVAAGGTERLGRVVLPGRTRGIAAAGTGLYAADDRGGVWALSPRGPVAVGALGAPARAAAGGGDLLAIAAPAEVWILDARDPEHPQVREKVPVPGGILSAAIAVTPTGALGLAAGPQGLWLAAGSTGSRRFVQEGETPACSVAFAPGPRGEPCRVLTWDVAGALDTWRWDGRGRADHEDRVDLEIDGGAPEGGQVVVDANRAYVATGTRMVHVVDLRTCGDRGGPTVLSSVSAGTVTLGISVAGDRVLVADSWRGLVVLDRARLDNFDDDDPLVTAISFRD